MQIFSIYKATNKINGKSYIEYTKDFDYRKKRHIEDSRYIQNKFYIAVKEFGWDSFEWEIICQSLDGKYLLNEMEPYFIQYYDSHLNGYNSTKGGEGIKVLVHSEVTKKKISASKTGIPRDSDTKRKLSISMKGNSKGWTAERRMKQSEITRKQNLGRKLSEETKNKMSISLKGKPRKWTNEFREKKSLEITMRNLGSKHSPERIAKAVEGRRRAYEQKKLLSTNGIVKYNKNNVDIPQLT
jgi:group I intron endonuclease